MDDAVGVEYFAFFFFQAEDGIRDLTVTGVQTCALPIYRVQPRQQVARLLPAAEVELDAAEHVLDVAVDDVRLHSLQQPQRALGKEAGQIGRAACRGRGEILGVAGSFKKKKEKDKGTVAF